MLALRCNRMGKNAQSQVWLNNECIGAAKAHESASCPDPEKLATLISIKRALGFASRFLPPGSKAMLQLAKKLLELKIESQIKGDAKSAANAKAAILKAKKSPSRYVRAGAAALEELLR